MPTTDHDLPRLRQAVLVAADHEAVTSVLQRELALADPFVDPGVAEFGLRNGVFAVGDTFVEVVSPVRDGTTAGRYLDRQGGDGGYMAMFQIADVEAARARLAELGVRVVWTVDHDDITDLHLHPRDVPGAIVDVTEARPAGSWRWAGPPWEGAVPAHGPGGIVGLTVAAADPAGMAQRWAEAIGATAHVDGPGARIDLDRGRQTVRFVEAAGPREGICGIDLAVPAEVRAGRDRLDIGGVGFTLLDA
ncbi:MAG: VOC family protein [Acidimicrobiia bacterium]|nr:VOC family protein [Acidimicrobiia bacterium]